ncbi:MAG: thioredoxin family protein [Candidatus Cloacimonadales bacterium]|jgi:glutaredoxin-like protein|nr:thioredoxin family protein [Candidatus Cloacimonadota bacterium]MDD2649929.1 thioredoxin family protein [Candidatus Cloacimonadota bacterium]MDD3501796.1 thioredoxin family protein [Candidatus Cloacimonadota bacterium]MDX9976491.1 thioredoxin family protein [Candidatus Cloacimonadales bacterium]
MAMLDEKIVSQLKELFKGLDKEVNLKFFTQELECAFCKDTHNLLQEVAASSDKIKLEVFDFQKDKEVAEQYKIDKIPALVVMDEKDRGIRFFGIPSGYEFTSLIESIKLVSTGKLQLKESTKDFLNTVKKPVHLQVFVTPTCPYCPPAVVLAHQMAYYSEYIRADMVEASEFNTLSIKYNVQGVPRTVVNETEFLEGAAPEEYLIEKIKAFL